MGLVGFVALIAYRTVSKKIESIDNEKLSKEVFDVTVERIDGSLQEIRDTLHEHGEALKESTRMLAQIASDIDWLKRNGTRK